MKIKLQTTSILLSYNLLRSLKGFSEAISSVMYEEKDLAWIDLSHNLLTEIDYDFKEFPKARTLYLHCNYFNNITELVKL